MFGSSFLAAACRFHKGIHENEYLLNNSRRRSASLFLRRRLPGSNPGGDQHAGFQWLFHCPAWARFARVWQRSLLYTNDAGIVTTNCQSDTEIGTGICYLSNGEYVDSVEQVEPVAGGAQAIQGRHQVQWALNANTPGGAGGAVSVTTADTKQLSSTSFCLVYFDTASGSNAAIGQLKDCIGSVVPPNQVVYADAFSNVTADIWYTYTKAGLTQDILVRSSLPPPDAFGLADESSVLEIWSEFFNSPEPEATTVTNGNMTDTQILDFGDMKMGVGRAFFLNGQEGPVPAGLVTKQWIHVNNRTFLIEAIGYSTLSNLIQQFPLHASNLKTGRGSLGRMALLDPPPARRAIATRSGKPMKLAKVETKGPRLDIDYVLLSSTNILTLQGDQTYLVTSLVNVTGTVYIEGGTVVKYTNSGAGMITATNIVCQTAPFSPGVFTSMNDNSVGTVISNSTGAPSRGSATYLNISSQGVAVFRNLRCSYAGTAISGLSGTNFVGSQSITNWDCQFVNCGTVVAVANAPVAGPIGGGGGPDALIAPKFPIYVYNALFSRCGYGLYNSPSTEQALAISAVNVTADQVGTFQYGSGNSCAATNSLFTSVTNQSGVTFASCYTNASSNGVYQAVGAGSYYLATNSTNRAVGTSSIDPALLADLQARTTYPPVVVAAGALTNNTNFSQQALRNTGTPDRGFHYFPIDYAVAMAVSDATVTVLPGTVLAGYGSNYGVWLYTNAVFNSAGTATSPNYIVRYNTVQEQSNTNWESTNWLSSVVTPMQVDSSSANFTFTDGSVLGADGQLEGLGFPCPAVELQNCQFYNGTISASGPPLYVTNCLFRRVNSTVYDPSSGNVSETFYNNLFWKGEMAVTHDNSGEFTFRDNLFDQTAVTLNLTRGKQIDVCSNNAYVTTNNGVLLPTNGAVFLTNSPAFQTGALGVYYYPTNLTNLIHAGSRSAPAAGLYHYTVTTNNVIEGANTVSVGFHYVAVGTNGLPLVSNTNGVPDYLADANGNGIVDAGEIPWTNTVDIVTQPLSATNIVGGAVTFAVVAHGLDVANTNLAYQWQMNGGNMADGGNIAGSSTATLTITNLGQSNVALYSVMVSNAFNTVETTPASLTVLGFAGTGFQFPVFGPLGSNFWVMTSTNLANWTTLGEGTLTNDPTLFADAGASNFAYRFYEVWNGAGCSGAFGFVTVPVPGRETNLLADQLVAYPNTLAPDFQLPTNHSMDGSTVTEWVSNLLSVSTFSSVSESWTTPSLPIAPGGGAYIYNSSNSQFAVTFVGTVAQGTLTDPIPAGNSLQSAMLPLAGTADALGLTAALTNGDHLYQWIVSGQSKQAYLRTNGGWSVLSNGLWVSSSAWYLQVGQAVWINAVTNGSTGIWSNVPPDPPSILIQPQSQFVFQGNTVNFAVSATNESNPSATLTYQWYFNGTALANGENVSGAASATLTLRDVQAANEGTYWVIVGVVGATGTATSAYATLSEINCGPLPDVNSVIATNNGLYVLTCTTMVSGITYDLLFSTNLSGPWTTNTFLANANPTILAETGRPPNGYWIVEPTNNQAGPTITTRPSNEVVAAGSTAVFSVTATGLAPLSYQWQFNGNNISGATSTSLSITNVQATNVGAYTVIVSNVICWDSATAMLGLIWDNRLLSGSDQFGAGLDASPALSLDGSTVYIVSTGDLVYALNATNGAIKWTNGLATGGNTITSSAAISSNGAVYIGSKYVSPSNGYLYSFTTNLQYNWSNYLEAPTGPAWASVFGTPTVTAGGTIYVGTAVDSQQQTTGTGLYSFNSNSNSNWFFQPQDTGTGSYGDVNSSATVGADGTVYFLSEDSRLYALYPSGNVKWFLPIPGQVYPDSSPAIAPDGSIVVGSGSPYLYAVNPDGSLKWFCHVPNPNSSGLYMSNGIELNGNAICSSPVIDSDGTVYVGTREHNGPGYGHGDNFFFQSQFQGAVYAITNGQVKWAFTNVSGWVVGSVALAADGTVYAGAASTNHTYGMLYAISNGVKLWALPTGGDIVSSPVICNDGGVIFSCEDSNVYKVAGRSPPAQSSWPMYRHDAQHTGSLAGTNSPNPAGQAPFPNDGYFTNGGFTFSMMGPPGTTWSVYASTNLTNWDYAGTNWTYAGTNVTIDTNGIGIFTNFNLSVGLSNMYYFLTNNSMSNGCRSRVIGFVEPYTLTNGKQYMIADPFYEVDDTNLSQTVTGQPCPPMNTVGGLFCGRCGLENAPDFDYYPNTIISLPGIATNKALGGCTGQWGPNGDILLLPGRGALINAATNLETFVWYIGLVAEAVTNQILPGTNYVGSALPVAGGISSWLGYTNATTNDLLLKWDVTNQDFVTYTNLGGTNWSTNEPYIGLAEGFILVSRYSNTWIQRLPPFVGD